MPSLDSSTNRPAVSSVEPGTHPAAGTDAHARQGHRAPPVPSRARVAQEFDTPEQPPNKPLNRSCPDEQTRRYTTARPLTRIKPQLTRLIDEAPSGKEWLHEIKYDGCRMHARLNGRASLLTPTDCGRKAQR